MPKPLIQMTKYEVFPTFDFLEHQSLYEYCGQRDNLIVIQAESTTAAAPTSETTGLKVFEIRSEDYKSYQLYSATEELRAQERSKNSRF